MNNYPSAALQLWKTLLKKKKWENSFHGFVNGGTDNCSKNCFLLCVVCLYDNNWQQQQQALSRCFTGKKNQYTAWQSNLRVEQLYSNTALYCLFPPIFSLTHLSHSTQQLALAFLCVGRMCLYKAKPALASSSCRWLHHLSTVDCVIKDSSRSHLLWLRMSHLKKECILVFSSFCLTTEHSSLLLYMTNFTSCSYDCTTPWKWKEIIINRLHVYRAYCLCRLCLCLHSG